MQQMQFTVYKCTLFTGKPFRAKRLMSFIFLLSCAECTSHFAVRMTHTHSHWQQNNSEHREREKKRGAYTHGECLCTPLEWVNFLSICTNKRCSQLGIASSIVSASFWSLLSFCCWKLEKLLLANNVSNENSCVQDAKTFYHTEWKAQLTTALLFDELDDIWCTLFMC